jgi:hypothetical protein
MKIHCAQLVEGALRSALLPGKPAPGNANSPETAPSLLDNFSRSQKDGVKINFLPPGK